MTSNSRAICRAVFTTLSVLIVGATIPIWIVWSVNPWEGVGSAGTLWQVIWHLPSNLSQLSFERALRLHSINLIYLSVLLPLSMAIGFIFYRKQLHRLMRAEL